jgi:hypothetical protein
VRILNAIEHQQQWIRRPIEQLVQRALANRSHWLDLQAGTLMVLAAAEPVELARIAPLDLQTN